jgi:hypothetical protein
MTEDEKLLERLLERRMHHSPGQARDLAEADFDWIKRKGVKPAEGSEDNGSPSKFGSASLVMEPGDEVSVPDHYLIETRPRWDEDEIKRMSES